MNRQRSSLAMVRNPVVGLPSWPALHTLPDEAKEALALVLQDIARQASVKADESWKRRKGPMAAYWRAVSVYAGHIKRALR